MANGLGENIQMFLNRHFSKMTSMIQNGNEWISASGQQVKEIKLRRLIVIEDDVVPEASWHLGYIANGFKDSDGVWGYPFIGKPYNPQQNPWWDPVNKIDWGNIHEMFHTVFHVTDHYGLDVDFTQPQAQFLLDRLQNNEYPGFDRHLAQKLGTTPEEVKDFLLHPEKLESFLQQKVDEAKQKATLAITTTESALENVVAPWRKYTTYQRVFNGDPNELDPNIMNLPFDPGNIASSDMWEFVARKIDSKFHDLSRTIPEGAAFPPSIATKNILRLGDAYKGRVIKVYRTDGTYDQRELLEVTTGTVDDTGDFNLNSGPNPVNLFRTEQVLNRDMVQDYSGVLFIRIEDPADPNNPQFIWTDVRLFIQAYEKLGRPAQGLALRMQVANNSMQIEGYDWESQLVAEALALPPTPGPTQEPTIEPTQQPTANPTEKPTQIPTLPPTQPPPTPEPTQKPPEFKAYLPAIFKKISAVFRRPPKKR